MGETPTANLQFKMVYCPAVAVSSVALAQLAAAHLPNKRALDPQSAARQTYLCPSQPHYGLHPAMFATNDSLFLVASKYYRILTVTHVITSEGWKAELD